MAPPRMTSPNTTRHPGQVTAEDRRALLGHRGVVLWLTGLSGAGKSTLAYALEARLVAAGCAAFVLDGDNVRQGLCGDLGFSAADRRENIRRVAHLAALFADAGLVTVAAFISPARAARDEARRVIGPDRFVETFLDVPLAVCEARDPKGLYKRARAGDLPGFTGIDAPYEPPTSPELTVRTQDQPVGESADAALGYLRRRGFLPAEGTARNEPL